MGRSLDFKFHSIIYLSLIFAYLNNFYFIFLVRRARINGMIVIIILKS